MVNNRRIGLIVPSSNVTMETEVPALFRARESVASDRFTFHSSRMRMQTVSAEELTRMDEESERCATELADAAVEVQAYACLVAIMSQGLGYHRASAARLGQTSGVPVLTSAGALVDGLHHLGAKRISLLCPYRKPLAQLVVDYLEHEGIEVQDHIALEIDDNLAVGNRDPLAPSRLVRQLDTDGVDAIVASACVQMPSLASIDVIEQDSGLPTLSAATATAWGLMRNLELEPVAPGGGALLTGAAGPGSTPRP